MQFMLASWFPDFWKYDMIVPSVRVQSRVPGFEEEALVVIGFRTNDLEVFKVYVVTGLILTARIHA